MKTIVAALILLFFSVPAHAQDVTTSFTLGAPTANCIAVLTQDGAPSSGAVCPSGFFGGGGLQIWLHTDPVAPGQSLTLYQCTTSVVSNTVPVSAVLATSPDSRAISSPRASSSNVRWQSGTSSHRSHRLSPGRSTIWVSFPSLRATLRQQALEFFERLAPNSLDVAVDLNNLGMTAQYMGDMAAARQYHERGLNIRETLKPNSL